MRTGKTHLDTITGDSYKRQKSEKQEQSNKTGRRDSLFSLYDNFDF